LITENFPFEGGSDQQFIRSSEIENHHQLSDIKSCGYFEIFRIENKID
jgi:hypothetical protein